MYKKVGFVLIVFVVLVYVFYTFQFGPGDQEGLFLSMATFLFAIFVGFFISRQSDRSAALRDALAEFSGHISAIYRNFIYIGGTAEKEVGEAIVKFYDKLVNDKPWDYAFTHKSSIITDLHKLTQKHYGKIDDGLIVATNAVASIESSLVELQIVRKRIVNLRDGRMPKSQWLLIFILAILMVVAMIYTDFTTSTFMTALLSAAVVTATVFVFALLKHLDDLSLIGTEAGASTIEDVVEIIKGNR